MSFVTLKTRPLIARGGTYLQKGVDTLVATFPRSRSTAIAQSADQELVLKQDILKDCY